MQHEVVEEMGDLGENPLQVLQPSENVNFRK